MKKDLAIGLLVPDKAKASEPEMDDSDDVGGEKLSAAEDVMAALKDEDAEAFSLALERFVMCCSDEE